MATPIAFDILGRDKGASAALGKVGKSADDTGRKFGFLAARSHGLTAGMSLGFGKVLGAMGAVAAVSTFKGFVNEAREARKVGQLTEAVIKSTGGVARISADGVGKLAESLSNKVGVDDEAIQSGANLLLTFTNIRNQAGKGNDIFNQATSTITDMTAALNNGAVTSEGMKASSIQLGKALNDPIKGVSALSKVGVSFTEQQKKQIKTLVASGDTLGAQKIILGELQKEFGGAAAAATDPMQKLGVVVGNLKERLGTALLPIVDKVGTWLGTVLPVAIDKSAVFFRDHLQPPLRQFAGFVQAQVLPRLQDLGGFLIDKVVPALGKMASFVSRNSDFFKPFAGFIIAIVAGLKVWAIVQGILNVVLAANPIGLVVIAIAALAAGIVYAYKHSETFRKVVDGAFKAVKTAVSSVVDFFKKLGPNISKAVGAVTGLLTGKGKDIVVGLAKGVYNNIKGLVTFWAQLPGNVLRWIGDTTKTLGGRGLGFVTGLSRGIYNNLTGLARFWAQLPATVLRWIGDTTRTLMSKGAGFLQGLWSGLIDKWNSVTKWIGGLKASVSAWLGDTSKFLVGKGKDVLSGFWNGLKEKWTDVTKWVGGIAQWIKDHKGPIALDAKLLVPAGRAIMDGFLSGLKSGAGPAWNFVKSVGGKSVDALRTAIGGPFMGGGDPAPTNLSAMQALVRTVAAQRGWGTGPQWDALYQLVQHESGFRPNAQNPTSTAYGLFQFLNSTWGSVGATKTSDPWAQTIAGLRYIANAYGSPMSAWSAWQSRSPHWYEKGTPWVPNDQLAFLHKGEGVIPADENRRLRASTRRFSSGEVAGTLVIIHKTPDGQELRRELLKLKRHLRAELGIS